MKPNPLLQQLGFSATDRVVILHTDDIGMCQAALQAFEDLWDFGTISSGAAMVPCPWFPATAEFCKKNPEVDMGVHATLNSEWGNYRWGPLYTRDRRSGLMDQSGYFHQRSQAVFDNAQPEEVAKELDTQVQLALSLGINITHIDSHIGTILHPHFVNTYLAAGEKYRVPNLMQRDISNGIWLLELSEQEALQYQPILQAVEQTGRAQFDGLDWMPLDQHENRIELAKQKLSQIPVGLTHFLMHPCIDSSELRAIAGDWRARVADYKTFLNPEFKSFLKNSGIQVIGYRAIRDAMYGNPSKSQSTD